MKRLFNYLLNKIVSRFKLVLTAELEATKRQINQNVEAKLKLLSYQHSTEIQCLLVNHYKTIKSLKNPQLMPDLRDTGFKVYSEYEEDGLLLYIFSIVGTTNKNVVEICAGDGTVCMATNLIINHGWQGLLFDGDEHNVKRGTLFFKNHPTKQILPPKFVQAWITKDNINDLILNNGFKGEIDLLSLDMDGNDYWLLKSLNVINPRVIICETQDIIPSDLSLTMPYNPDFYYHNEPEEKKDFRSVSLLAMVKLCHQKGYRLIGSNRHGFNVIFMRNDIGLEYFPEISIDEVHQNPWTLYGQKERWPIVKDMPWEKI